MEAVDLEHGGTGLSGGGPEFWRLYFGETLRTEEGSEEVGDTGEHGVRRSTTRLARRIV